MTVSIDNVLTTEIQRTLQALANLKGAGIDPHMNKNTRGIAQRDGWGPFEMAKERIFPFGLSHEGDSSRRADGEETASHTGGECDQKPLPLGHLRLHR